MSIVTPPQLRPRKVWDIALSVILLVLTYAAFLIGATFMLLALAFTDKCTPETCNTALASHSAIIAGALIALVGLVATAVVVVLLVRRFRAWWVAAAALALTILGWIISFAIYGAAVS
ncbi:MAG: hypothetical protein ABIR17_07245 [Pseudolysinimonas sp.]|uniref:hypothetical protein n=1 Tax=Pseudolysinimonas sp. TaxID=2680009 RepID=UPI0032670C8A